MKIYEAKAITDDIVRAFEKLIPQLSPNSPIPSKTDLVEIINSKNTILFIAEDEIILGTLTLSIYKTPTGNKVWIEDVVVDNDARGKAIGQKLTQYAINYVSKKGFKKIDLTSTPERVAANKLYQKMGFKKRKTNVYRLLIEN